MRIAFCGKGGSGKSTMAATFARYLARSGRPVLALDADVNVHLPGLLGFAEPKPSLASQYQSVASYFEGNRRELQTLGLERVPEIGTIPPSGGSRFVRITDDDQFLSRFADRDGSLWSLSVGAHDAADAGDSCYHLKLNAAELLLHRTIDAAEEWVVVDTTAGVDTVGTSLIAAYDVVVFAVEPSEKSLSVIKHFVELTASAQVNVPVLAIPNKIRDAADLQLMERELTGVTILPHMPYTKAFRRAEQGDELDWSAVLEAAGPTLEALITAARLQRRDWAAYHQTVCDLYERRCAAFWNGFTGTDLSAVVDRSFVYPAGSNISTAQEQWTSRGATADDLSPERSNEQHGLEVRKEVVV